MMEITNEGYGKVELSLVLNQAVASAGRQSHSLMWKIFCMLIIWNCGQGSVHSGVYGVESNLHPSLKKLTSNGSKTIIIESNLIGFWRAFIFATQELQLHSLSHNKIHDHLIHANYHQHVCSRVLFLYRIFLNMKETNKCCVPTLCRTICWMGFLFYSHSSQLYYSPSLFMRKQRPI